MAQGFLIAAAVVFLVLVAILVLLPASFLARLETTRHMIAGLLAGYAAVVTFGYGAAKELDTRRIEAERQMIETLNRSLKALNGDVTADQRLAAIYSLEQISHSSQTFYRTVIGALDFYVKRSARVASYDCTEGRHRPLPLEPGVQAALNVLANRDVNYDERYRTLDLDWLTLVAPDCSWTKGFAAAQFHSVILNGNFRRADLRNANFNQSDFADYKAYGVATGSDEGCATISPARSQDNARAVWTDDIPESSVWQTWEKDEYITHFNKASLQGAQFNGANLEGASFAGANLEGASFIDADLKRVTFADANLDGADFRNTDLTGADFTRARHVDKALLDGACGRPRGLAARPLPPCTPVQAER